MKVSVIVPVYNVEQYIRQCAQSLFSQTWEDIEFIFVDDGSPDNSIAIITRAMETDADMVYCDFFKEYPHKPPKVTREASFSPPEGHEAIKAMHNSKIRAYMWNKLLRRSLYNLDALFVPVRPYHEDIVFQSQLLYNAKKCVHVWEPLYHYRRRRSGALTGGKIVRNRRESAQNMLAMYNALPKDSGPLTVCGMDVLMRAGWYCCATLDFKLLASCPDAVRILAEKDDIPHNRVTISKQRYTKFCCKIMQMTIFALWKMKEA